ncbi:BTB/POZ domain-containing protein 6-like [Saccostrea echinata]|uniref:BTB/POZ domain-containing protein 6-like n=1 Tax=Saccostrea echinata TaxID=191078 RepID=UPI002A83495C|nr:BTB/POZ domain-containing protein 6-like [Saccostrea echinata]
MSSNSPSGGFQDTWAERKSVLQCNKYMLLNKEGCDVTFLVGANSTPIKAHKYVLASRSPVFFAMFLGPAKESSDEIIVPDIEDLVFEKFLRYVYFEDVKILDGDNVLHVLYAAKKYSMKGLESKCREFLVQHLNTENVCVILESSHTFGNGIMEEKCLQHILRNGDRVLQSPSFSDLCRKCVKTIISSNDLEADEAVVFKAAVKWAGAVCCRKCLTPIDRNIRKALGDIFFEIRFPIMQLSFFADKVASSNILIQKEKIALYEYLCRSDTSDAKLEIPFNMEYRKNKSFLVCKRFNHLSAICDWENAGRKNSIAFSCTRAIWMHGIMMYESSSLDACENSVIVKNELGEVMYNSDEKRNTRREFAVGKMYNLFFGERLKIQPLKFYTISVKSMGPKSYHGEGGKRYVSCGPFRFEFRDSCTEKVPLLSTLGQPVNVQETTQSTGQIPGIIFSSWL